MPRRPAESVGRGKPCPICYLPMIEVKGKIVCPNEVRHEANRQAKARRQSDGEVQAA